MKFTYLKNQNTIKIIVSLLILIVLFKLINFNLIIDTLKNVNSLFIIVLAFIPINILLRAIRLMIILNKDGKIISIQNSFYLNLAGITLNLFMPASTGDIAKSYYGYKWHGIKEEMLTANIFDKFMALFSIFFIGFLASLFLKIYLLSLLSLILTILIGSMFFYPQIIPWNYINKIIFKLLKIELDEEKLKDSFAVSKEIKIKTFLISILAFLVLYFQFYLLCLSFSLTITFSYVLAVAPLLNLAILFPFTLNGLGTGEVMTIYLFSLINISPSMSIVVSLLSQVVNSIIPGLFGFFIIMKR